VPLLGERISFCIFMASTTRRPCPASTWSPALTRRRNDFTGHGRYDLLAAFGFDAAVAAAAPGARIDDLGGEFLRAGLEFQFAVW